MRKQYTTPDELAKQMGVHPRTLDMADHGRHFVIQLRHPDELQIIKESFAGSLGLTLSQDQAIDIAYTILEANGIKVPRPYKPKYQAGDIIKYGQDYVKVTEVVGNSAYKFINENGDDYITGQSAEEIDKKSKKVTWEKNVQS